MSFRTGENLNHPIQCANKPWAGKGSQLSVQGSRVGAAQVPAPAHSVPSPAGSPVSNSSKQQKKLFILASSHHHQARPCPSSRDPRLPPLRQLQHVKSSRSLSQNCELATWRPSDLQISEPRHRLSSPQNPTHTALPAPGGAHRPKASRARLIYRLNPKLKLDSLNQT